MNHQNEMCVCDSKIKFVTLPICIAETCCFISLALSTGVFKGVKMTASALPERVVSLLWELVPALLYFRPERLGRDVARLGGVLPVKHLVAKRPG